MNSWTWKEENLPKASSLTCLDITESKSNNTREESYLFRSKKNKEITLAHGTSVQNELGTLNLG